MNPSRVHEILEAVRADHDLVAKHAHTLENREGEMSDAGVHRLERCLEVLRGTSRALQTELLPKLVAAERSP